VTALESLLSPRFLTLGEYGLVILLSATAGFLIGTWVAAWFCELKIKQETEK